MANAVVDFLDANTPESYRSELPAAILGGAPQMSTGIEFHGERILSYSPQGRATEPDQNPALRKLEQLSSRAGLLSVLEPTEESTTLWGYWHLSSGYLTTYVDKPSGEQPDAGGRDDLVALADAIRVDGSGNAPRVSWSMPVSNPDMREADARPLTSFMRDEFFAGGGNSSAWPVVRFRKEPPWIRETGRVALSAKPDASHPWMEASLVTSGVRIACEGPGAEAADLERLVEQIGESMVQLS
jgi:hypothetical protein